MADGREEALDRALDDFWDRLVAEGIEAPPDRFVPRDFAATVRRVHAADRAPAPSNVFVKRLREDLMQRSVSAAPQTAVVASLNIPPLKDARSAPWHPRLVRRDDPRRWPAVIELAAMAAMVLALLGGAFGGGAWFRSLWTDEAAAPGSEPAVGMYRGNAARTGVMPGPGPQGEPGLRWRHDYADRFSGFTGTPTVANGTLYATSGDRGIVVAIDVATGDQIWLAQVGRMDGVDVAVASGLVYVATAGPRRGGADAGYLIALDEATGKERWRYETGGVVASSPAIANHSVFVTAFDGTLRAVDDLTGRERWRFIVEPSGSPNIDPSTLVATPGPHDYVGLISAVSPAVADGLVYAASNTGNLFAIDAETGAERWRFASDGNMLETPAIADGTLYLVVTKETLDNETGSGRGWVYAIDARSGQVRWVWDAGLDLHSPPAVANGMVYVAGTGAGDAITALDAASGKVVWGFVAQGRINAPPTVADDTVYTSSDDGALYAIDGGTGQIRWRLNLGRYGSGSVVVADGLVVAGAEGHWLFGIGGSRVGPGTPAATPVVNGDVSGLSVCDATPRPASEPLPEGTPSASLVPVRDWQDHGQPAQILPSEIPAGTPASDEAIGGIVRTLQAMADCDRPGFERQLLAFYSDDFLRREWVRWNIEHGNHPAGAILGRDNMPIVSFDDARELPDGRVGVLIMYNEQFGRFVVFVRQGDRWLIDELLEVEPQLGGKG